MSKQIAVPEHLELDTPNEKYDARGSLAKMSVTHELRNWLHHMLLAAQVGHVVLMAQNFSEEEGFEVRGFGAEAYWQGKESWVAFLQREFASLQIGDLSLKTVTGPDVTSDEAGETAHLSWRLMIQFAKRNVDGLLLDCEADLEKENGRWMATRIAFHPPHD